MKYFTQVAIGYFSGFFPLQNKFESYFKLEKTWASNKLCKYVTITKIILLLKSICKSRLCLYFWSCIL